ncbi:hypothetical protein [Croceimicrobium sp.]|uniref:hypothetical protein n=1 Tax=Croceimicrobium sp. TaxID=2828340 RepID=UPI003BA8CBD0
MYKWAFLVLLIFSACKSSQVQNGARDPDFIRIRFEEVGGFTGGSGMYSLEADGRVLNKGAELKQLSESQLKSLQAKAQAIRKLAPFQSSGQHIQRSIWLESPQDTLSFSWGLEDTAASAHDRLYHSLYQLTIE